MLSSSQRRLIEHVAAQRGFELLLGESDSEVSLASSLVPGILTVTPADPGLIVRVDLAAVTNLLAQEFGNASSQGLIVSNESDLYAVFGRAFQLCGSLPDHPLHLFGRETAGLPNGTEAERLVLQRIGQDVFRKALEGYWEGRCAVTGIEDLALLRASHIKPWSVANDAERLDVYNGILLVAHLDAAFDKYLATFAENGDLVISSRRLSPDAVRLLTPKPLPTVARLSPQHQSYLAFHRQQFRELEAAEQ